MIATSAKSLNLWPVSQQITLTASEDVSAFDFACSHYLKRPPQMWGWGVSNHRGAWVTLLFLALAQIALNRKKAAAREQPEPSLPSLPVLSPSACHPHRHPGSAEAPAWVPRGEVLCSHNPSPANTVPAPGSWMGSDIPKDSTQVC